MFNFLLGIAAFVAGLFVLFVLIAWSTYSLSSAVGVLGAVLFFPFVWWLAGSGDRKRARQTAVEAHPSTSIQSQTSPEVSRSSLDPEDYRYE